MKRRFITLFALLMIVSVVASACAAPATQSAATELPQATTAIQPTQAVAATEPPQAATATEPAPAATEMAATEPAPATTAAAASELGLPAVDTIDYSGNIIAAGSSTVFPLAEAMAERFKDEGFAGDITIDSIGSGAGFERFCTTGETDISTASRAIKDAEVENCAKINRTPIEFRVGTDALAVVVSSANTFLTDITLAELAKVYSPDVTLWSEVNPAWPAEEIKRFTPGTDSGTFDYFVEAVMAPAYEKDGEKGKAAILAAPGIQLSEDDNVLVQGVEGSPYAIGYFGYAYYVENAAKLKAVSVAGVTPDLQTAEDGTYPLARPLFIYSDAGVMTAKPQVAAFINFFLTYVNEEIETVGYFPASQEALQAAADGWLAAQP